MKIGIFLIAYRAVKTIIPTYERIPQDLYDRVSEIYVNDDASQDRTYEILSAYKKRHPDKKLNIFRNEKNLGYGGNQKAGLRHAIDAGYDIVVLLHGDGQYPPERIKDLMKPIEEGKADMVFGSRMTGDPRGGGMPLYKFYANKFLTAVENWALGLRLSEYHSGFRAYSCRALSQIAFEQCHNRFSFDSQILIQLHQKKFRIAEIDIPTYYGPETSQVGFWPGIAYGVKILASLVEYHMHRISWIPFKSKKYV